MVEESTTVNGTLSSVTQYSYGHDLISQRRWSNSDGQWTTHFFGYDGHGSVRFLTDKDGNVTDTLDYDAFGILVDRTGTTPLNYMYAGEQWDSDLGMYYLRARYMNQNTGRFWTQDSFEGYSQDPLSLHKYLYTANDPINKFDPSGKDYSLKGLAIAAAIGGILSSISTVIANHAVGRTTTTIQIVQAGVQGALLTVAAIVFPGFGVALGTFGVGVSSHLLYQVYKNPNSTSLQTIEAIALLVASLFGSYFAIKYYQAARTSPNPGSASLPKVPDFPLDLTAPEGLIIESEQASLFADKVGQIPQLISDMLNGKPVTPTGQLPPGAVTPSQTPHPAIPACGGFKSGNRVIISEGNHRMAAALEYFKQTGDRSYVDALIEHGNFDPISPNYGRATHRMTK